MNENLRQPIMIVLALAGISACTSLQASRPESKPLEASEVARELRSRGHTQIENELVHIAPLELAVLSTQAATAWVEGRAFPLRAIFSRDGEEWSLRWLDGVPVGAGPPYPPDSTRDLGYDDAARLAGDLLRIYEDPDPRYAVLLKSIEDIPLDRKNSDYLRDLTAGGLDPDQRRSKMLRRVTFPIEVPQLEIGPTGRLSFFSWSFFGGSIKKWKASLHGTTVVVDSVETMATEVGSYDLFP